ncbi:hypothetical protein HMPREF9141_0343 [Prevotella multiformis DSM 16608]|uniref:Uncharacterized protein n=1 Tax=Prevotella multiformis DSM 16608 TaxID=888743 RepID=F0F427_9BACT|nr:hypothetical protein HMPREF9141_0343 [Prevotella multiformis DSM 16608]
MRTPVTAGVHRLHDWCQAPAHRQKAGIRNRPSRSLVGQDADDRLIRKMSAGRQS